MARKMGNKQSVAAEPLATNATAHHTQPPRRRRVNSTRQPHKMSSDSKRARSAAATDSSADLLSTSRRRKNDTMAAEQSRPEDNVKSPCRACSSRNKERETYPDKRKRYVVKAGEIDDGVVCDHCNQWYHCRCVDLEGYEVELIDSYACKACQQDGAHTTMYQEVAPHRARWFDEEEKGLPEQVCTRTWSEKFTETEAARFKPPPASVVRRARTGHKFVADFRKRVLEDKQGWTTPYLIERQDGLFDRLPEAGTLDEHAVIEMLGPGFMVQAIDVHTQRGAGMSLASYGKLLKVPKEQRTRLYNIISLEFAYSHLSKLVNPPPLVQQLSWSEALWPMFGDDVKERKAQSFVRKEHNGRRPAIDLFCLMGMGGSFTDYHLDLGGTSVWYHVYKGRKVFYLIEPTPENLDCFQRYHQDESRAIFFPDMLADDSKVHRVVIDQGSTLLMPGGWIHAVFTPVDSLVFGGNFLTDLCVELQCEVNAYEARFDLDPWIRVAEFELMSYYGATRLTRQLKDYNEKKAAPAEHILRGAQALALFMCRWAERDSTSADNKKKNDLARPQFKDGQSKYSIFEKLIFELEKTKEIVSARNWMRTPRMSHSLAMRRAKKSKDMMDAKGRADVQDETVEPSVQKERKMKESTKRKAVTADQKGDDNKRQKTEEDSAPSMMSRLFSVILDS